MDMEEFLEHIMFLAPRVEGVSLNKFFWTNLSSKYQEIWSDADSKVKIFDCHLVTHHQYRIIMLFSICFFVKFVFSVFLKNISTALSLE